MYRQFYDGSEEMDSLIWKLTPQLLSITFLRIFNDVLPSLMPQWSTNISLYSLSLYLFGTFTLPFPCPPLFRSSTVWTRKRWLAKPHLAPRVPYVVKIFSWTTWRVAFLVLQVWIAGIYVGENAGSWTVYLLFPTPSCDPWVICPARVSSELSCRLGDLHFKGAVSNRICLVIPPGASL